jgi:AcrR family transcriptional regulator
MNASSTSEKPVRLRARLREATCEAILVAAEQAFAEEGARARMESIAARAGIAVGTLYNHFADRDALWEALRGSRLEALLARIDAALEASRGTPFRAALRAFLGALEAHWAEHRGFLTVLVHAEPSVAQAGVRAQRDRTVGEELVARAARLVRRGVAEGALRAEGADVYPVLLIGMIRAVMVREIARGAGSAGSAAATLDRVVEVFLSGAGTRP